MQAGASKSKTEAQQRKANTALNGGQRRYIQGSPRFVFVPFQLATDEQPLKYLQITGLPKDVFPLASKTKGNPTPGTSQSGTLKF